ncbi:MAG: site-specific integrase, partial [Planctomycetaceae bacterium]|nr:site-specific integrase [Planctomycetaceae bacterium]
LRVGESQSLSWDNKHLILADLTGKYPMFRFHGSLQKNGKTEVVPMAPDFAAWLKETPKRKRTGMVMAIPLPADWTKGYGDRAGTKRVAKVIARVGKATNIRTSKTSTPTAHDLRRSFASNWSQRVLPQVLQTMMRHSSITTTMGYYVSSAADAIGKTLAGLDLEDK